MRQFTQKTNDLTELSRIILVSKRERIIRAPERVRIVRKSNIVAQRTVIIRSIQKETGLDEPTARGIMKIRGLK